MISDFFSGPELINYLFHSVSKWRFPTIGCAYEYAALLH